MKFNFRKIASTIASTAILGSTVALAAAASFPAPFVQNGAADVAIVYGNSLDLVAVTDISTSLSSALASSGNAAGASNDAYPLFTSSTPLQLNNSLNSVKSSVSESNLPSVLSDQEFSGNVDVTETFRINLGGNPRAIFSKEPTSSDDPAIGLFYSTTAANALYNATVSFDQAVNFTHEDTQGESINLFGQKFTVSSASTVSKLVLFKSAETLYLSVGAASSVPSQTVEVNGETYTVELVAASDTSATVKVTNSAGQSDQKEINEAASKKILGVEIAVDNADESTATNTIQAQLLVGADRLTLQDGDEVTVGTDNDPIDGTQVDFETTTYTGNISKITIQVFAADGSSDFMKAGDEFVDPVFGSFRLVFNPGNADLTSTDGREEISIKPSGNDMGVISFSDYNGNSISNFEWLNNKTGNSNGAMLADSNNWPFVVRELGAVNESGTTILGNEDEAVLLELTDITNNTNTVTKDTITVKNLMTGDTTTGTATSEGTGTIDLAGNSYTFKYIDDKSGDGSARVRFDSSDSSAGQLVLYPTIETSKGANLGFYQPLTITMGDIDGIGTDLTGFQIPDGDGYTAVTVSKNATTPASWDVTFGSTTTQLNTSATGTSVSGAIGQLTYNVTSIGTANSSTIYLVDSGANILRPAVVLFEDKDESSVYNTVIVETSGAGISDNGVSVSEASFSWNGDADMKNAAYGSNGYEKESVNDIYVKLDQWGTLVTTDETDSDQYNMVLSYPEEQTSAMIYVDGLVEGSGSTTLGDVKVMDDELASSGMSGKNLIVVGGSCVNTAASTLLGGSTGCGASWTAATGAGSGEWVIQTFANPWASSKVATLVAGWEQGDTANAATYLKTQNPLTNVGHKLTGTTATAATVVTA